jgi:hypothetical protein
MRIAGVAHLKRPVAEPFAGGLEALTHGVTRRLAKRHREERLFATAESFRSHPVEPIQLRMPVRNQAPRHKHDQLSAEYIAGHHACMDCMQAMGNARFDEISNNSPPYVPTTRNLAASLVSG